MASAPLPDRLFRVIAHLDDRTGQKRPGSPAAAARAHPQDAAGHAECLQEIKALYNGDVVMGADLAVFA